MYTMSIMMPIFVRKITFCITVQRTGMDTVNTKVVHTFVKSASTFRSVQDDGNTEVFYFKNATATFSSFTHEPEVVKF